MFLRVFIFLTISLFMVNFAKSGDKTDVVIYGDASYSPYSFKNNTGKSDGIYVKILEKVFAQLDDYNVKIMLRPWKRGLQELEKGDILGLFPPYHRPAKRPYIAPYSEEILQEEVVVFCRKEIFDQKKRENFPADYYGLKFGNNRGYLSAGDEFFKAVKEGKISLEEADETSSNIKKLSLGRLDCYVNDRVAVLWELKHLKNKGQYNPKAKDEVLEVGMVSSNWGYIGYSKSSTLSYKDDFIEKVNVIIKSMRESGEIKKIIDNYLGTN